MVVELITPVLSENAQTLQTMIAFAPVFLDGRMVSWLVNPTICTTLLKVGVPLVNEMLVQLTADGAMSRIASVLIREQRTVGSDKL